MSTRANFTLSIDCPDSGLGGNVFPQPADLAANRQEAFVVLSNFFLSLAGGLEPGAPGETKVVLAKGSTAAGSAAATGTITFSSASGTVGAVIAGVTKTAAHGADDTADAVALVAAILADTTLNKIVTASNVAGVVTITALVPGVLGNQITTVASGTGVTASGAKLAGGVGGDGTPVTVQF